MDYRDVRRALTGKGFSLRQGAKHEIYRYIDLAQRKTQIRVSISRGSSRKSVSSKDRGSYARQMLLSAIEFDRFVTCSIEQHAYEALLRERSTLSK